MVRSQPFASATTSAVFARRSTSIQAASGSVGAAPSGSAAVAASGTGGPAGGAGLAGGTVAAVMIAGWKPAPLRTRQAARSAGASSQSQYWKPRTE